MHFLAGRLVHLRKLLHLFDKHFVIERGSVFEKGVKKDVYGHWQTERVSKRKLVVILGVEKVFALLEHSLKL